jgi:DNA helicase-2/ATP-dependent DNA helicase PcrA
MSDDIEEIIREIHEGDQSQLDIIFSEEKKIVVEAPAGCGKTTTMVSKVAYLLAKGRVPKNKRILALTFSVNAAYKMKKDIANKLPLMGVVGVETPADINSKITITNYHGLARKILGLYGYLIDQNLSYINDFHSMNENNEEEFIILGLRLEKDELDILVEFSEAISQCNVKTISKLENEYIKILIDKFIPNRCITFNGYLLICRKLLNEYKELKEFYQKLYPVIIIDEFQDTNILSWEIVKKLISNNSELFFMGDSLQRIYGFIGAIPGLLDKAIDKFNMKKMTLSKNYRFRGNANMLLLGSNIRKNAENYLDPIIDVNAIADIKILSTQEKEADWVIEYVKNKIAEEENDRLAILVQQRGPNINEIINRLEENSIPYFYALFSDEDNRYIDFHRKSAVIFFKQLNESKSKRINKTFLNKVFRRIVVEYDDDSNKVIKSLLMLTKVFFEKITTEFIFLDNDDKIAYINDTFENRALKQNMDVISSRIFVSTIHGAKGLEWENVVLPDIEPYLLPNYGSLCGQCDFKVGRHVSGDFCKINVCNQDGNKLLEELSIFYVAVTRARKSIVFSASRKRIGPEGVIKNSYVSCMMTLPGIQINRL